MTDRMEEPSTQVASVDEKHPGVELNTTNLSYQDEMEPTEEEIATLRKVPDKLPVAAFLVAIVELAERFAYYGLTGPFQNYMQLARDNPRQPGALGLGKQAATALSYFFQFFCYVTPILGGYIADSHLGRYNTILVFCAIYTVGLAILFGTSTPASLDSGTKSGLAGYVVGIIIIGLGTGGIKSNIAPLIADQYTETKRKIKTLKTGERVIVDPATTIQSIFMMFYFCINVGSLSAIATTELELHVDFWAAYLLPFLFFFLGIIALVLGRNKYIRRPPMGSIIPDALRICWMGAKNKFDLNIAKPTVRAERGLPDVMWSDLFVDQIKRALVACKVFLFYPVYWLVYGQMLNNFVSQAAQMELHGIPNDIMTNIDPITVIIFIPICERLVYPALRRVGIQFKPITRIFWGFMFAAVSMAYAAICQKLIYNAGPCFDAPLACAASEDGAIPNHIHVAVQTPAYFFLALSEIFASITGLEYAYTKAPANMKSLIMAMFLLTNAGGAALGIAMSSVSVDPKVLWQYVGLAVATFLSGCLFWIFYGKLNKTEEEMNVIDAEYTRELNAEIMGKVVDSENALEAVTTSDGKHHN